MIHDRDDSLRPTEPAPPARLPVEMLAEPDRVRLIEAFDDFFIPMQPDARIPWLTVVLADAGANVRRLVLTKLPLGANVTTFGTALLAKLVYDANFREIPGGRTMLGLVLRAMIREIPGGSPTMDLLTDLFRHYALEPRSSEPGLAPEEWKGSASAKETEEVAVIQGTFQPVWYLAEAAAVARAVVHLDTPEQSGTGFLVGSRYILTCAHVRYAEDGADLLPKILVTFGYERTRNEGFATSTSYRADLDQSAPAGRVGNGAGLDYTLFVLDLSRHGGNLPDGVAPLRLAPDTRISVGQLVSIIQHPDGGPKVICMRANTVQYVDDTILQYTTSTLKGSSGAPVLNAELDVVALHCRGSEQLPEPSTRLVYARNEGLRLGPILNDLQERSPDVYAHVCSN